MKQAKVLNEDEFKRLLSVVKDSKYGIRDECLVQFSFLLGLRVKEISSLLISDVLDSQGNMVKSFYLKPSQSKGEMGRTVYLTNKGTRRILRSYLEWREGKGGQHLFWTQKGGYFTPNSLQMKFSRMYKKAGFIGCSSHSGRRTFGTNLIQKGFDIKSVSVLMGHSNISTTSRYIDTNPVRLADMVGSL